MHLEEQGLWHRTITATPIIVIRENDIVGRHTMISDPLSAGYQPDEYIRDAFLSLKEERKDKVFDAS